MSAEAESRLDSLIKSLQKGPGASGATNPELEKPTLSSFKPRAASVDRGKAKFYNINCINSL